jgi:hypothetical protein
MQTPELTIQDQPDVDDQIAARIRAIEKRFGGLGQFFERLRAENEDESRSSSVIDKVIEEHLTLAARISKEHPSGHS